MITEIAIEEMLIKYLFCSNKYRVRISCWNDLSAMANTLNKIWVKKSQSICWFSKKLVRNLKIYVSIFSCIATFHLSLNLFLTFMTKKLFHAGKVTFYLQRSKFKVFNESNIRLHRNIYLYFQGKYILIYTNISSLIP